MSPAQHPTSVRVTLQTRGLASEVGDMFWRSRHFEHSLPFDEGFLWAKGQISPEGGTHMLAHTSKQSHTPHTQSRIPPENGSLQGEKRTKRQTHTERVSAGNRWKLALIALLTSDPEVKRYDKANTHLCALFLFYMRTFTLRHFAGRSNCRATVCVSRVVGSRPTTCRLGSLPAGSTLM